MIPSYGLEMRGILYVSHWFNLSPKCGAHITVDKPFRFSRLNYLWRPKRCLSLQSSHPPNESSAKKALKLSLVRSRRLIDRSYKRTHAGSLSIVVLCARKTKPAPSLCSVLLRRVVNNGKSFGVAVRLSNSRNSRFAKRCFPKNFPLPLLEWPPRRNLAHKFSQEMLDTISEITDMFPMYSAPLPVPNRNVTITPTYQTSVGPIISCNQQNRSSTPNRVADLEDRASTQLAEVVVTQCARVEPTETGFASTAFLNESALSQDSTSNNTPKYISSSSSDFATVLCDSDDGVDPVDQPTPSGLESHRPATPIPSSPPNKMSSQQVLIVAQEAQVAAPTAPAPVRRRLTLFNASETQNRPTFRIARVFGHLAPIDLFESEVRAIAQLPRKTADETDTTFSV
jgi:hypothetical protein